MNSSVVKIYFPYILVLIGLKDLKFIEVVFFVSLGFILCISIYIKNNNFNIKNNLILLINFILIYFTLYNYTNKYALIVDREISVTGKVLEIRDYEKDSNLKICKVNIMNSDILLNHKDLICIFYKLDNTVDNKDIIKFKGVLTKDKIRTLLIKNCTVLEISKKNNTEFSTNMIKRYIKKTFSIISLDKNIDAFLNAIILGNKDLMNSAEKDIYRKSGTMHLFAVSGIHVGFIYLLLNLLFSHILRNKFICQGLITIVLAIYLDIVNYPPSAQRAFTMIVFWQITKLFNKKVNLISSLLWSALITVFWDTEQLFSLGYQLSYTVVFAIVIIFKTIGFENDNKLTNFFSSSLKTSYAAFCGSMLLIFDYFGMIVPVSILINMLVVPICFILIIILFSIVIIVPLLDIYFFSYVIYFFKYIIDFIINVLTYRNITYFTFENRNDINNLYHLIYPFTFLFYRNFFRNKFIYLVSLILLPFLILLFFV
jgi:competence protein ComEC